MKIFRINRKIARKSTTVTSPSTRAWVLALLVTLTASTLASNPARAENCDGDPICEGIVLSERAADRQACKVGSRIELQAGNVMAEAEAGSSTAEAFAETLGENPRAEVCEAIVTARRREDCLSLGKKVQPICLGIKARACNALVDDSTKQICQCYWDTAPTRTERFLRAIAKKGIGAAFCRAHAIAKTQEQVETEISKRRKNVAPVPVVTQSQRDGTRESPRESADEPPSEFPRVPHGAAASTAALASPAETYVHAEMAPCCEVVRPDRSVPGSRVDDFHPSRDPYYTVAYRDKVQTQNPVTHQNVETHLSWDFGFRSRKHYQFDQGNLELGRPGIVTGGTYSIPAFIQGESEEDYTSKRLLVELKDHIANYPGTKLSRVATFIDRGAHSWAFFVHSPIPETTIVADQLDWAAANSHYVLKLRSPVPKHALPANAENDNSSVNPDSAIAISAAVTRRDLVMVEIFRELAHRFKFKPLDGGEPVPLVEGVPYVSTQEQILRGVLIQNVIQGVSPSEITKMIYRFDASEKEHPGSAEANKARDRVLSLGFDSIDDAKARILALEAFFRVVHDDVNDFSKKNQIKRLANYTPDGTKKIVGFDYNRGHNVLWNPKAKLFFVFDP